VVFAIAGVGGADIVAFIGHGSDFLLMEFAIAARLASG
jgi:hypothetical protein